MSILCSGLLLLLVESFGQAADREPNWTWLKTDRVDLPTVKIGDFLFIEAWIDGAGPFRLMVDTGTIGLALSAAAARQAGLKLQADQFEGEAALGSVSVRLARVQRLISAGFVIQEFSAEVLSDEDFKFVRKSLGNVHGFIGMLPFKDVVLELDFPRQQVSVLRAKNHSIPTQVGYAYENVSGWPYVKIDMAGKPISVLIDTGASAGFSFPNLDEFPLLYPKSLIDGEGYAGIGPWTRRGESAQLAGSARLGKITWEYPMLSNGEATIGVEALKRWKVVVNQTSQRLYLIGADRKVVNKRQKPPENRYKLGIYFTRKGQSLHLLEVDKGNACDRAGLRKGDSILMIDGQVPDVYFNKTETERTLQARHVFEGKRNNIPFKATVIVRSE